MNDNDIVVEAWNTVLFDKFVRFAPEIGFSTSAVDLATPRSGSPKWSVPKARPRASIARTL